MLSKRELTIVVAIAIVVLVLGVRAWQKTTIPPAKGPVMSGRSLGSPGARVKIVEFTDFQCPACASAAKVVHRVMQENESKLFVELKYFPLPMHKNSRKAAVAAECARVQGKFWPMQELLFRDQGIWAIPDAPEDNFLSLARSVGIDEQKMMRCMASAAAERTVADDLQEGKNLGVKATPTFFVNGKAVVGSANFEQTLKEALR